MNVIFKKRSLGLLMFGFLLFSCKEDNPQKIELDLSCLYSQLDSMQNMADTAKIGDSDGTFPKANADELLTSIKALKEGISKAKAGMLVLPYEVETYCIAANKAINTFKTSYQITLQPGTPAELLVFGIDKKGYIDFGESPAYGGSNSFTVESWLKYNQGFFEFAIADFIATFSHDGKGVKQGWMINFSGSNLRTTLGFGPAQEKVFEWGSAYPTNYGQWNHIVTVYDGSAASDQLKMYVNGNLFFSKTNDVKEGSTLQQYQPNTRNLKMWAFMEPEDNNRNMTGYMKKFRLWSAAKSAAEVKELMQKDVTGTEANLICAWDFTLVPDNANNIPDKTGRHTAKLVGAYKWNKVN